jgi:hypothetical protein
MKDDAVLKKKLKDILARLLNATDKLESLSKGGLDSAFLHALQSDQECLLAQLHEMSVIFQHKYNKKIVDLGVEYKLFFSQFEKANQAFANNLKIRQAVNGLQMGKLLQSRVALSKLKDSYGSAITSKRLDKLS